MDTRTTKPIRIGLIGFGRTGREVARHLISDANTELRWVVRESNVFQHRDAAEILGIQSNVATPIISAAEVAADDILEQMPVDAIIDFSSEHGLEYYATAAVRHHVAVVSAVSHYSDVQALRLQWMSRRIPTLWSPNITLGVNFLLLAAQTLQRIAPEADIEIIEEHFKAKQQVSGTALRISEALHLDMDHIHMVRAGGIVGTHEVLFGFGTQSVRLRHEAISREAFGAGALFAAQHVAHLARGMYKMEDLLLPYFTRAERPTDPVVPAVPTVPLRIPA